MPIKSAQKCYDMVVTAMTLEGVMPMGSQVGAKQMGAALSKRREMQDQVRYDVRMQDSIGLHMSCLKLKTQRLARLTGHIARADQCTPEALMTKARPRTRCYEHM